jgi:hypothetical protein
MTQSNSAKWEKFNKKRSAIIHSKKPFQKRMEEEMELEKKVGRKRGKVNQRVTNCRNLHFSTE